MLQHFHSHWSFVWKTLLDGRPKPHATKIWWKLHKPQLSSQKLWFLIKTAVFSKSHSFYSKMVVFSKNCGFWLENRDFDKNGVFFEDFGLKVVKLTNTFHSRVRTQGANIDFFPENSRFCLKPWVLVENCGFPNERPLA